MKGWTQGVTTNYIRCTKDLDIIDIRLLYFVETYLFSAIFQVFTLGLMYTLVNIQVLRYI